MEWVLEDYPSIIYDDEQNAYTIQDTSYTLLDIYDFMSRTTASWQDVFDHYTLTTDQFADLRAFVADHRAELDHDLTAEITRFTRAMLHILHGQHQYSLKERSMGLLGFPLALFFGLIPASAESDHTFTQMGAWICYLIAVCFICVSSFAVMRLWTYTCTFSKDHVIAVNILKRYAFVLAYDTIVRIQIRFEASELLLSDRLGNTYRLPCSNTMKQRVNQLADMSDYDWVLHLC